VDNLQKVLQINTTKAMWPVRRYPDDLSLFTELQSLDLALTAPKPPHNAGGDH